MSAAAPAAVELFSPPKDRFGRYAKLCEVIGKGKIADQVARVKELIYAGADVNGVCFPDNAESMRIFKVAIHSERPEIVKVFIDGGVRITAEDLEDSINRLSTKKQDVNLLLIDNGAPVTPKALRQAIFWGKEKVVKRLLEKGVNPNDYSLDGHGMSSKALAEAIWQLGRVHRHSDKEIETQEQILDMLLEAGADVNTIISGRRNALEMVLQYCPKYAEKILKAGADRTINEPSASGLPLVYSALRGKWDAVKLLLKYGADPRILPMDSLPPAVLERIYHEAALLRRGHALAAFGGIPGSSVAPKNTTVKSKRSKTTSKASRRNRN